MALLEILAAVPIESFAGKVAEKSKLINNRFVIRGAW